MDSGRLLDYMRGTLEKNFDAVYQLVSGDFLVPLCSPPTAALACTLQLCSSSGCNEYPVLLEECSDKRCRDRRCSDDVLTFLRAACMDPRLEDGVIIQRQRQGSVMALLLLAGASDLASARESCGTSYETPCNPVIYAEEFPLAVLDACTAPAAQRAAAWPRVLRRLSKEDEGAPREALARVLFLELCCEGTPPNFFEEWGPEEE